MVRGAIITTRRVAPLPGYLLCVGGGFSSYDCSCWRPTWGAVKETRSGLWLYMYMGGIVTERNGGDWEATACGTSSLFWWWFGGGLNSDVRDDKNGLEAVVERWPGSRPERWLS
jgi:hypothetical protein